MLSIKDILIRPPCKPIRINNDPNVSNTFCPTQTNWLFIGSNNLPPLIKQQLNISDLQEYCTKRAISNSTIANDYTDSINEFCEQAERVFVT